MSRLSVFTAFEEHGVEYLLAGAGALALHRGEGLPLQLDLCYHQRWRNCECLCRALEQLGASSLPPQAAPIPLTGELRGTAEPLHVLTAADRLALLPAVPGLGSYEELSPGAVRLEVGRLRVPVLSQRQLSRWLELAGLPPGDLGLDR